MEIEIPNQLSALAHPRRLDLFRLLMRRYPQDVSAGEIAEALALKPNTASTYLNNLRQARLIVQSRDGTSLLYRVDIGAVRGLFDGLLGGCCQNRPDLCLVQTGEITMPTHDRPLNVLFICTGNSARSILAESILRTEGQGRFNAFSAGTRPAGQPNADVMELLAAKGHDTSALRSKSVDEFSADGAPAMDFVFTVCDQAANEECPAWPGQPMSAHWGLADPVKATGTEAQKHLAFQQAYGLLRNRIAAFVSLPFETLDRMSLQHRLDDIAGLTGSET